MQEPAEVLLDTLIELLLAVRVQEVLTTVLTEAPRHQAPAVQKREVHVHLQADAQRA